MQNAWETGHHNRLIKSKYALNLTDFLVVTSLEITAIRYMFCYWVILSQVSLSCGRHHQVQYVISLPVQ